MHSNIHAALISLSDERVLSQRMCFAAVDTTLAVLPCFNLIKLNRIVISACLVKEPELDTSSDMQVTQTHKSDY